MQLSEMYGARRVKILDFISTIDDGFRTVNSTLI